MADDALFIDLGMNKMSVDSVQRLHTRNLGKDCDEFGNPFPLHPQSAELLAFELEPDRQGVVGVKPQRHGLNLEDFQSRISPPRTAWAERSQ